MNWQNNTTAMAETARFGRLQGKVAVTGGANNAVHHNYFDVDSGNGGIAAMFVLGTNDRWYVNSLSTAVTTTIFSFGDPA